LGRLIVIDGASCSGKSTVVRHILQLPGLDTAFAKRYTTRAPRPGDEAEDNYHFVTQDKFRHMVETGKFIEHKDYLFGMSYGLPRKETLDLLSRHDFVLALIDLGRFDMVKQALPEAFGILLTVPIDTIERRLRKRGTSTEEQIAERLENARLAFSYAPKYDMVLDNDDGKLDGVISTIAESLRK